VLDRRDGKKPGFFDSTLGLETGFLRDTSLQAKRWGKNPVSLIPAVIFNLQVKTPVQKVDFDNLDQHQNHYLK
jgi:hypothetical protein